MGCLKRIVYTDFPHYKVEDAVDKPGLIVTRTDVSTGDVKLVDADKEAPIGVTLTTSQDPKNVGTYLAGQELTIVDEGEVELILASDNAAIVKGDPLMAVADGAGKKGVADKLTFRTDTIANFLADLQARVGYALATAAQNAGATYGTKVRARLTIFQH